MDTIGDRVSRQGLAEGTAMKAAIHQWVLNQTHQAGIKPCPLTLFRINQ